MAAQIPPSPVLPEGKILEGGGNIHGVLFPVLFHCHHTGVHVLRCGGIMIVEFDESLVVSILVKKGKMKQK